MKIEYIENEASLAKLIGQLVREGVTFRAYPQGGFWTLELTGGY